MKSPLCYGDITTQNLTPTADPTLGSAVTLTPANGPMALVTVTGVYTGVLSAQITGDGVTWLTLSETGTFTPVNGGASTPTIASAATGLWRVPLTGYVGLRISGLAAMTGTARVTIEPGLGGGISTDATPGTDQDVNLVGINGVDPVTGSGTATAALRVELPTNGTGVVGLNTGSNVIGKLSTDYASTVTSQGLGYTSRTDQSRAANQTPYTAGDVVGGVITFSSAGPTAGRVLITSADLGLYISAIPSGMGSFTLFLYDATPGSAIADNSPFDMPSGDRASYLGQIALGVPIDLGSTCYTTPVVPSLEVKLAAASTSLFAYLVTASGYTPAANSEVYSIRISSIGVSN